VLAERLHCGFLRVPIARPEGLVFETLFHEPVVLALPVDHPLAAGLADGLASGRAQGLAPGPAPGLAPAPGGTGVAAGQAAHAIAVSALRDEGFILVRRPGAAGLYANFLALCEAQGFRPRVVAEVPRMMSNLNLVAAGAGIWWCRRRCRGCTRMRWCTARWPTARRWTRR